MSCFRPALVLGLLSTVSFAVPTSAQTYPARGVTIIVPFSPGGGHDFTARTLAARLSTKWQQQVVVDNRPGANGMIGAALVTKAAPDGYTILLGSPAELVISQSLYKSVPYDVHRDLAPITLAAVSPIVLISHPSTQIKTPQDLLRVAKRSPNSLSYGTPGAGSAQHLAGAWICKLAGIDMIHVPYKGAAPATVDALAGQIPLAIVGIAPAMPHIKAGKVNALAIMAPQRLSWLPMISAIGEVPALKNVNLVQWMGIAAPAKTPPALLERIQRDITATLKMPEVSALLVAQGVEPTDYSPQAFGSFLEAEQKKYAYLVKLSGASAE